MHSRSVIVSYWTVVLLALPLWWSTTSIVRLSLPVARVHVHERSTLRLPVHIPDAPRDLRDLFDNQRLHLRLDHGSYDSTYTVLDHPITSVDGRTLRVSSNAAADTLAALLAPALDSEQRVAHYSPRYRLAFSLLNEDAAAGGVILGWEITNAIHRTFVHLSVSACFTRRLIRLSRAHPRPALAVAQLYNRKPSPVPRSARFQTRRILWSLS